MSDFQRYAIYYVPEDAALASFGASWLGWDVSAGAAVVQPDVPGIKEFTRSPRKYGFHGTLKPPFRLADGKRLDILQDAFADFAANQAAFDLPGLRLARLGRFLALVPDGACPALDRFAFACVSAFDTFRSPADEADLARRRKPGLSAMQEEMLQRWGYPYVGEAFRFHLTLTGRLDADTLERTEAVIMHHMPPVPRPFRFASVALAGERQDGMFKLIHHCPLSG